MNDAAELCRQCAIKLTAEGRALGADGLTHRQFFDRLVEQDLCADARRFLAHALGRRRALAWGCRCVADAFADQTPPLLDAVRQYLAMPEEAGRQDLLEAGMAAADSPAGCLALAAFFSGGTVSRSELPFVRPESTLTARMVSVAVYLAAVGAGAGEYQVRLRRYLELGLSLAEGAGSEVNEDAGVQVSPHDA